MTGINLTLAEYEKKQLPETALPFSQGVWLWRTFDQQGKKLRLTFPSPKTDQQWELTAQGWVGHIAVHPHLTITIEPKVPLPNLFSMWEIAYGLRDFDLLAGLAHVNSLASFYEHIVRLLLQRVQKRQRQGLYQAYQSREEAMMYVRGQVKLPPRPSPALSPTLLCRYQQQTADVPDNQILTFTLAQVARGRRCSPSLQTAVRRTVHHLQQVTTLTPFRPEDCRSRSYTRLNQDYQVMHALCRFLLDHQLPDTAGGDHPMQPFLLDMARLYEQFVAAWLQINLPSPWQLKAQETVTVGRDQDIRFNIDLVLYDSHGRVHAVLDTKYKTPARTAPADLNQIVTYAQAKGSAEAALIYPIPLATPLDVTLHHLHLRSLTFALDGDLDQNGHRFLAQLLPA